MDRIPSPFFRRHAGGAKPLELPTHRKGILRWRSLANTRPIKVCISLPRSVCPSTFGKYAVTAMTVIHRRAYSVVISYAACRFPRALLTHMREQIPVNRSVRTGIPPNHVSLRIECVGICTRAAREIDLRANAIAYHGAMLASVRAGDSTGHFSNRIETTEK